MKRIFPIYKGKDLSKMGMGYSNEKSARKFMNREPIENDFKQLFDEDYWFEHYYIVPLKKERIMSNKPRQSGGYSYGKTFYSYYDAEYSAKIYLPNVPDNIKDLIHKYFKLYLWFRNNSFGNVNTTSTREQLDEYAQQLIDNGYYHYFFDDQDDYKKKLSKFIKENVQFVEKEVTIVSE